MYARVLLSVLLLGIPSALSQGTAMPCPFTRTLQCGQSPALQGQDVALMQNLLVRSPWVKTKMNFDGVLNPVTCAAMKEFLHGAKIQPDNAFGPEAATLLLAKHSYDGYKDSGKIDLPGSMYKVHVKVMANRSIETEATLYSANMTAVFGPFRVRTHGQDDPTTGGAMGQFCGDGYTPTGLMSFDLNSPEDDPKDFGPYPVNRAVEGHAGNAGIRMNNETFISYFRDGILMHTGEWDDWHPPQPMPNSHGCIHSWPENIRHVWQALIDMGVVVHQNTDGKLPYPYKPQGELSVECIDC